MKEVKYEIPKVVEIFYEWYGKLPENDKKILCNHLRNWLKTDGSVSQSSRRIQPYFRGRLRGVLSNRLVGKKERLKCTHCEAEINLISCGNCGNQVEIK